MISNQKLVLNHVSSRMKQIKTKQRGEEMRTRPNFLKENLKYFLLKLFQFNFIFHISVIKFDLK